jgi:arsenate reductase
LLEENGVAYSYREYKRQPLSEDELRTVFAKLGLTPRDLLRRRDRAYRELGLTGEETDERLIQLMAEHPTLLERPIGVLADRAVVARPPDKLLQLAASAF